MNPHWDHQHRRLAIALAIIGLAMLNDWEASARAEEPEVQFSIMQTAEFQALQEFKLPLEAASTPDSEPEIAPENGEAGFIEDMALQPASYQRQSSYGARSNGRIRVGYDDGFVIASPRDIELSAENLPYILRINGWGQLRHTNFVSQGANQDLNQFQLKRARLIFSGHVNSQDFAYYIQLDGRSSSGDDVRLLDYLLTYDLGHHVWGWRQEALVFKTGKYKMPFSMARYVTGKQFEFTDRSMASTYFDVNRSLAWGLGGAYPHGCVPWNWEVAIFNGLVTGGAETGSSGALDDNFAYSGRLFAYPIGEWNVSELADFEWHDNLAMRTGMAFATSTINSNGATEFGSLRVVDSGKTLASILPFSVRQYTASLYAVDASFKWRGWSTNFEYYFRYISQFDDPSINNLFDHGFWLQLGKFIVPRKLELLARWSRVDGDSGTLGLANQSSDEIAGGFAWYLRDQETKLTVDATHLNGAPISSPALDISPGDDGWLYRAQIQFAF